MAGKRGGDSEPPTQGGTEAMRAVIRPQGDSMADSTKGPFMETVAIPAVADRSSGHPHVHDHTTEQSALAMTECPTCHMATPVARFCTDCGAALVQRRFCAGCGAHLLPMARFCDACGLKVPA
jgi:hypothetical protein